MCVKGNEVYPAVKSVKGNSFGEEIKQPESYFEEPMSCLTGK